MLCPVLFHTFFLHCQGGCLLPQGSSQTRICNASSERCSWDGRGWGCHRLTSLFLFLLRSFDEEQWCVWSSMCSGVAAGRQWSCYHCKHLVTRSQLPRRVEYQCWRQVLSLSCLDSRVCLPRTISIQWKKPDTRDYVLYDSTYMKFKSSQSCITWYRNKCLGVALE